MNLEEYADDVLAPGPADYFKTDSYQQALKAVENYIAANEVVVVADIVRALPEHSRTVFSLLDDLRVSGKVYWDEWRPLPTLIFAGDRRIPEKSYKYTWRTARDRTWQNKQSDLTIQ